MKHLRKVTLVLDRELFDEVEDIGKRLGFLKQSETYRYIIKKGVEAVKKQLTAEVV